MKIGIVLIALIIGIGIGIGIGMKIKKNEIELHVGMAGDIVPYVKAGDRITWTGGAGIQFPHSSLCVSTGPGGSIPNDECTVKNNAIKTVYLYHCQTVSCPDPGVGYGDSTGTLGTGATASSTPAPPAVAATGTPHQAAVFCDSNNRAAADPVVINTGDTIVWYADAGLGANPVWNVNGLTGVCTPSSYQNGNNVCNPATKPNMTVTYSVTAPACGGGAGTATVQ